MPRRETDIDATRAVLLDCAETLIRQRGAVTFTITDIAAEAGMSQSNVYRFFENKDALAEAMAGRWFAELIAIIEDVVEADFDPAEKLFQFFARRLAVKRARFAEDPDLFQSYMELGDEHFEVVRGYVDLTDHYMAMLIAEAMEAGYFAGLELDRAVSLVNLMLQPFVNPKLMVDLEHLADEANLRLVLDTILRGARVEGAGPATRPRLVSAS